MSEHISSPKSYVGIWLILMVLTGTTVSAAFLDLGPFNSVVALTIATIKAVLVVLFFMHVQYTTEKMTKVVLLSAVFWLLLLLSLSLADYGTRLWS